MESIAKAFTIRHTVKQKQTTPKEGVTPSSTPLPGWRSHRWKYFVKPTEAQETCLCAHTHTHVHRAAHQGGHLKSHQHPEGEHRLDCYNFTVPVGQPLKSALSHQLCLRYAGTSVAFQFTQTLIQQKTLTFEFPIILNTATANY